MKIFCDLCGKQLKPEDWKQLEIQPIGATLTVKTYGSTLQFTNPGIFEPSSFNLCQDDHDFLLYCFNLIVSDKEVREAFDERWKQFKASKSSKD